MTEGFERLKRKGFPWTILAQNLAVCVGRPPLCSDLKQVGNRFCVAFWPSTARVILEDRKGDWGQIFLSPSCPALTWSFFLQLYFLAEAELREPTPLLPVPYGSGASAILGLGNICLYISSSEEYLFHHHSLGGHSQGLSAVMALY